MSEGVILVTGVSGYLGSHVAKRLLESGLKVRGTVRSLENEEKIAPLRSLVSDARNEIDLVEADLVKDENWDKAVEGCTSIIHVASPFPDLTSAPVPEEDLLKAAKEGTLRVLRAAAGTKGGVKRVVVTSSFAAVYGETTPDPNKTYNEEDWTDPESPSIDPYTRSKVTAEKAAWEYVKELSDEEKFEITVINPTLIMGPPLLLSHRAATSVSLMSQIVNKTYPGVPKVQFPVCDVRDVAEAHVKALTHPDSPNHRHIISSDVVWYREIAASVAKEFRPQGYCISTAQLPYAVCWVAGLFNKGLRTNILPRIGKTMKVENKRMVDILGIQPTPLDTTFQDMVYAMVDLGIVRKAKKYKQVGSRAEVNGEVEEEEKEEKKDELKVEEFEPEDKDKTEEIKEENEEKKEEEVKE